MERFVTLENTFKLSTVDFFSFLFSKGVKVIPALPRPRGKPNEKIEQKFYTFIKFKVFGP